MNTTDKVNLQGNKNFYRMVLTLVIPIAIQNIINVGIQSVDVIMLGKVGESVLSASSLAGQVNFIMNLMMFGLASGATVLAAQYWGNGDKRSIEKIMGIGLRVACGIGIFFTVISFVFAREIMHIFSSEPEIINEGIKYLRIVCFSYLISAITMIYLNIMRSVERVIVSTVVYLVSMVANIVVNSLLIFGLFGFPKMGIQGAAIGTVFARVCELVVVIIYNQKYNNILKIRNSFKKINNPMLIKDFMKFSVPVIINELLWGAGISVTAAILGQLGSSVSAANAVIQVSRQLAMVVSIGIANATAIIVGKAIGEGKISQAKIYAKKLLKLSMCSGVGGGILILLLRPILGNVLSLTTQARTNLSFMMLILAVYVCCQAVSCTGIVGVFRAGGDTKYGVIVDVSTLWLGSIVFGFLAAFIWKLDFKIIYLILLCDEPLKLPFVYKRYISYKWLKNLVRK